MNMQQVRLANTSHVLIAQRGGARGANASGYAIGEELRTIQDVDLQVEEGVVSVAKGTIAKVEKNDSQQLLLNLGEQLGKFVLDLGVVGQFFERSPKIESAPTKRKLIREMRLSENPTTATPGAYIEVTGYDPRIGPNRGPKSPGFGGYQQLIGLRGQMNTLFGEINGVKTYKVQLEKGGEFVLGETEFKVINGVGTQESKADGKYVIQETDTHALMGLGYGLGR